MSDPEDAGVIGRIGGDGDGAEDEDEEVMLVEIEHEWQCDEHQDTAAWWSVWDHSNSGTPICEECGDDMLPTGSVRVQYGQNFVESPSLSGLLHPDVLARLGIRPE